MDNLARSKAAKKEFYRIHGKEIHEKQQSFEQLIRSDVECNQEGFINHPAYISKIISIGRVFVVQGWLSADAVWRVQDNRSPEFYIRTDTVIYSEDYLKPDCRYMHVSRENGDWYGRYAEALLGFSPNFRIMKPKERSYQAFVPINLFKQSKLERADV